MRGRNKIDMLDRSKVVVVLGASNKPERYSNMAVKLLGENDYSVIPVNPRLKKIEGFRAVRTLSEIRELVQTVTVYVGPKNIKALLNDIIDLKPERVILNPGTEADFVESRLEQGGVNFIKACTLVMLKTKQF